MTLNNLGVLQYVEKRMDESGEACDEALKIRRKLVQQNPATYLPDVADTLTLLGILHHAQNRMEEARKAFSEALGIYESLAKPRALVSAGVPNGCELEPRGCLAARGGSFRQIAA